jgi:hypothetical protein
MQAAKQARRYCKENVKNLLLLCSMEETGKHCKNLDFCLGIKTI